jgi:pimeloyl-ACP methyl ester carboxylesterase
VDENVTETVGTPVGDRGGSWEWADRWTAAGDLRLHHLEARRSAAPDNGRTLVALHGLQSHAAAWRPLVERLGSVDRVVCLDFRGHGESDWTRSGYWLADYAGDVVALLDDLELPVVDLVGHSLGARVSMVLCGRAPDRFRTVTLADTGPEVSRAAALQARDAGKAKQQADGFRDLDAVREYVRTGNPRFPEEAVEIRATQLYLRNWAGKYVMRGDREVTWILGSAGLREVPDMWKGLETVSAPLLLIHAMESFLLDDELARRMLNSIADPTYVRLPADHYAMYNAPDLFAAALDEFLAAH